MMPLACKVAHTQARDVARSRWLLLYAAFFVVVTDGLIRFSGVDGRAMLSLATVSLMVVPLVTLVLSTIYMFNAREFTELLLAQPVARTSLFTGLYLGLTVPLALAFVGGVGLPFLLHGGLGSDQRGAMMTLLGTGLVLTCVFTASAFVIALRAQDRVRGLGIALGVWLLFGFAYDAVVLVLTATFSDFPIERPLIAATLANPVDLARVLLLLRLDVAALMGYTGAVFQRFFGGSVGSVLAGTALLVWLAAPIAIGLRQFRRKDF